MFEIYSLPLNLKNGQEQHGLPGLLICTPPRRAQRSRSQDVLMMLLTPFSGTQPDHRAIKNILDKTAAAYYASRGSITNGMRLAAEHLNQLILRYNASLKGNRKDDQIFAHLNLAVMRKDVVFLVHAGSVHSFLLSPGSMQRFHAEIPSGRGLGVGRSPALNYYHARLTEDSALIFSAYAPETWTESNLLGTARPSLNLLRRRLISHSQGGFKAVIFQFRPSKEIAVHHLKARAPVTEKPDSEALEPPPPGPGTAPQKEEESGITANGAEEETSSIQEEAAEGEMTAIREETDVKESLEKEETSEAIDDLAGDLALSFPEQEAVEPHPGLTTEIIPDDLAKAVSETPAAADKDQPAPSTQMTTRPEIPARREKRKRKTRTRATVSEAVKPQSKGPSEQELRIKRVRKAAQRQARRKKLAAWWQNIHAAQEWFNKRMAAFLSNFWPGVTDESPGLSNSQLISIAVVVPIIVVAVATTIYMRNGRAQQYELYLQQAQYFASSAQDESDPALQRSDWTQTLHWLDIAEEYGASETSRSLRLHANQSLDALDGIIRVGFTPIYSLGVDADVNITHMVANDTELYMLDSIQGRVLRLYLTGRGYELDNSFSCGPGISGLFQIGNLVDMIALPPGNPNHATVLSVDGSGNILYCIPDAEAPLSTQLIQPELGWVQLQAITYYQGILYALDKGSGEIYTYSGYNMEFGEAPSLFFDPERDTDIPNIKRAIDFDVYGEDIYLLNGNGTITMCTSGGFQDIKARCDDPASFGDLRPGREGQKLTFLDAQFNSILTTLPPDPSLFLLDVNAPSIYHFSLQLNLDREIRPSTQIEYATPDSPATAFTISPSRILFLAYGNRVFYANLP
jgi:hypothetical protein